MSTDLRPAIIAFPFFEYRRTRRIAATMPSVRRSRGLNWHGNYDALPLFSRGQNQHTKYELSIPLAAKCDQMKELEPIRPQRRRHRSAGPRTIPPTRGAFQGFHDASPTLRCGCRTRRVWPSPAWQAHEADMAGPTGSGRPLLNSRSEGRRAVDNPQGLASSAVAQPPTDGINAGSPQ